MCYCEIKIKIKSQLVTTARYQVKVVRYKNHIEMAISTVGCCRICDLESFFSGGILRSQVICVSEFMLPSCAIGNFLLPTSETVISLSHSSSLLVESI